MYFYDFMCKYCIHMCILRLYMDICLLFLSMTLFMCHFVSHFVFGEGIMCASVCLSLFLSPSVFHWLFLLTPSLKNLFVTR